MPCCLIGVLAFLGPRIALIGLWLFDNPYVTRAVNNILVLLLGVIFLPWTTLAYVFAFNTFRGTTFAGLDVIGVLLVALGLLIDLAAYGGGGYRNRGRIRAR